MEMQESRNWTARLGLAFALALIACSVSYGQDVIANYLPGTDFSKYRTYQWVTTGPSGAPDEILDAQIKQSIDYQFRPKASPR
jgi:hypothetical protein